jgi:hypothetical protein
VSTYAYRDGSHDLAQADHVHRQPAQYALILYGLIFAGVSALSWLVLRKYDLIDDAYITAHYSDNVARGLGWVWNAGAGPTDGTTAPLWMLILASFKLVGLPITTSALALDTISYGCLAVLSCRLAQRTGGWVGMGVCLAWIVLFIPLLIRSAGMETPLYAAGVVAAFLLWQAGHTRPALVVAGLLSLIRGDGLLVFAVLFGSLLVTRKVKPFVLDLTFTRLAIRLVAAAVGDRGSIHLARNTRHPAIWHLVADLHHVLRLSGKCSCSAVVWIAYLVDGACLGCCRHGVPTSEGPPYEGSVHRLDVPGMSTVCVTWPMDRWPHVNPGPGRFRSSC